jgi:predicted MPP superfamily phosphohydrolase
MYPSFVICLRVICLIGLLTAGYGYSEAIRAPVVREVTFVTPSLPKVSGTIRILLLSDTHVQGPDMPPSRLESIVRTANALRPDVVVLAGDFTGENFFRTKTYSAAQAIAPLASLRAKRGVYAVLGNNDRLQSLSVIQALQQSRITLLESDAVQLGPVALGGMRTAFGSTIRRLLSLQGFRIVVSHSPDGFAELPAGVDIMLAGHTHCGQIMLPFIGALATGSKFGSRYRCGLVERDGQALVVTAGLGTSQVPIRLGAPPDLWLIKLQPADEQAKSTF